MSFYTKHVLPFLIGLDEAMNGLFGGQPDETISGTVGRAALAGKPWAINFAEPLINWLMQNPQHCQQMAAQEAQRRAETGEK